MNKPHRGGSVTPAETADFLRRFNAWRRGSEDIPMLDPFEIRRAIDVAVEHLDEIERLRAQNAILIDGITAASALMASAPAWHEMHREAVAELQRVKKEMES